VTAGTQVVGLEDLLSVSTLAQDVPATVELPRVWKPAGDEGQAATIIALIPAHNEETSIAATVASILAQDLKPDRILVICDNCTDDTEAVARKAGAETYVTVDNHEMKAGALNQALDVILPGLSDDDLVLVIDADTLISANFIHEAAAQFRQNRRYGGLSGVYAGKPGGGLVGWCQRNEFARWGFDSRQQFGKSICLSGAASIFTVRALRRVSAARAAGRIKGGPAVYNTGNFTEDFELSQALLHTGSQIRNLLTVSIETAVKPTWTTLHVQRRRWNRGITETLCAFGWTRHTWQMWVRWLVYTCSIATIPLSLFLISERLASGEGFRLNDWMALWLGVMAVVMVHKAITVSRTRGAAAALAAFVLLVELPYDTFLHLTFARSLLEVVTGKTKQWR
jgi:cellulose synthase/poly-beta-1,6-N-acetylglucosamine synthase-like glycosyltransferase